MSNPVIEIELMENIKKLDVNQKGDVLEYIKNMSTTASAKENSRRRALREIKTALKGSLMF